MTETKATKDPKGLMLAILGVLVVAWLLVWTLPFISLGFSPVSQDYHDRLVDVLGQYSAFGDLFNSFSALLTAIALCGVIYTAILQRRQINMQMEELEQTRSQTQLAMTAAKLAEAERDELQKEARERQVLNLRETILSAKVAIANAKAQLSTGKITDGERERREIVANQWIDKIAATLEADEQALAVAMKA